jgi:hypothetical protein
VKGPLAMFRKGGGTVHRYNPEGRRTVEGVSPFWPIVWGPSPRSAPSGAPPVQDDRRSEVLQCQATSYR